MPSGTNPFPADADSLSVVYSMADECVLETQATKGSICFRGSASALTGYSSKNGGENRSRTDIARKGLAAFKAVCHANGCLSIKWWVLVESNHFNAAMSKRCLPNWPKTRFVTDRIHLKMSPIAYIWGERWVTLPYLLFHRQSCRTSTLRPP